MDVTLPPTNMEPDVRGVLGPFALLKGPLNGRCHVKARYLAVGQNQWYHLGVGAPPMLEPILVVGLNRMFTGG